METFSCNKTLFFSGPINSLLLHFFYNNILVIFNLHMFRIKFKYLTKQRYDIKAGIQNSFMDKKC